MKRSLVAAATFAAITLGAASIPASAAVVGTSFGGISAHSGGRIAQKADYHWHHHHHHHRRWVCFWRHHHRHCYWRYWW
jgi:hypothetical protein